MHFLVFDRTPQSFDEMLYMKRPRPSIEIAMPAASSMPVEGGAGELRALIGVEYFRFACRASASSSAVMQKPVSIVFRQAPRQNCPGGPVDNRTRYRKPAPSEYSDVAGQTWLGSVISAAQQIGEDLVAGARLCWCRARTSASIPITRISLCTRLRLMPWPAWLSSNTMRREP